MADLGWRMWDFVKSLNIGKPDWALFHQRLSDEERAEAGRKLVERRFLTVLGKSEVECDYTMTGHRKAFRVVRAESDALPVENSYFTWIKYARGYEQYLIQQADREAPADPTSEKKKKKVPSEIKELYIRKKRSTEL
jgi:hypothetical protein